MGSRCGIYLIHINVKRILSIAEEDIEVSLSTAQVINALPK
jgi:hypothetical protein